MLTTLSMASLVVYAIFDVLCAALGVVALLRTRKCARGRLAVGVSGAALLLHGISSVLCRLWIDLYLHPAMIEGTLDESTERILEVVSPIRAIFGLLLLTAATVLLVVALAVRARHEFPAQPHALGPQFGGPHHGHATVGPTPQPQHQAWYGPVPGPGHSPPTPTPQHPGQWSMPAQPRQSPSHGAADSAQQHQAWPNPGPAQPPHHDTPPPSDDGNR